MDFDDLKRAWNECDRQLDDGVRLNARRLRLVLMRNADASDIDYTAPVVPVQKRFDTNWILRLARTAGDWIEQTCRTGEIAGSLQTIVMRVLGRRRTLRG